MNTLVVICSVLVSCTFGKSIQSNLQESAAVQGTIFRSSLLVTVDQISFQLLQNSQIEIDLLSAETMDNTSFVDLTKDCDASFIDSVIYLFKLDKSGKQSRILIDQNDDDDYNKGRKDGSITHLDSFLALTLERGNYSLSVGRFPLSIGEAREGKSMKSVNEYSPYVCQQKHASYGNYQVTFRSSKKIHIQSPGTYVGSSCVKSDCDDLRIAGDKHTNDTPCKYHMNKQIPKL